MNRSRVPWLASLVLAAAMTSPTLAAASAPASAPASQAASQPASWKDRSPQEKRQRLTFFLLLTADALVVLSVGFLLLIFIVRLGRETRKRGRSPVHTDMPDLWFQKPDEKDDSTDQPQS